jgi:uncharacterized membrane protein
VKPRIQSVDALRGLIMIIMALDHVRDFFHSQSLQFQPENLARATAALFLTRWITHFCAPVFVFTAGMSAYFLVQRGRSKAEVSRFLWTRGLWLVFLELTVVNTGILLFSTFGLRILEVIWVLGVSMFILAALLHLPVKILAPLSLAIIALHNLSDTVTGGAIGTLLHRQGVIPLGPVTIIVAYPLMPWFAVMAAGYCFGHLFAKEEAERRRWFIRLGLGLTSLFVLLRGLNIYGNPVPWDGTPLSFLNVAKYPPSLDFLLMTLGPAILLLSRLERPPALLLVFGRVPLFYFIVHFYLIHLLAKIAVALQLGRTDVAMSLKISMASADRPANYGFDLWVVYLVWMGVVAVMYPLCRWFGALKQRRTDWRLSYL